METIIHFIKHALGLCGESHPNLLIGGAGIITYCIYGVKFISNKLLKNKKKYLTRVYIST